MSKIIRSIFGVLAIVFVFAVSLSSASNPDQRSFTSLKDIQQKLNQEATGAVVLGANNTISKVITNIDQAPLQDNPDIYENDDPGSVVTMYVTVRRGNDLENTNHTWSEVNSSTKFFFEGMEHVVVPKAEVILQIGDDNGPLPGQLGYDAMVANATIQIRGSSASLRPQKSYKIELFNNAGDWRGQRTIALNKHPNDVTRIRNKLAFDLMKTIPDMVSLRTQFVHLYVKDETTDSPGEVFEDYGLFTQIELPNQRFLRNHLLDRYGQLYKTVMFEFYRYPEQLRLADDPLYSEEAFSSVLEIKGNKDHTKLLQMLDDVNNWSIPIETTFEKYFNEDNYFTWMAFNILVANVDSNAQNFYLYSPQNGQKWYFLPWDYDSTFSREYEYDAQFSPFQQGFSNYWGVILHRRVLMVPSYREKLDGKMHELVSYMTPERLSKMLNVYRTITDLYVTRMPDIEHLPGPQQAYDLAYSLIPNEPKLNFTFYEEALEEPLPFFLGTPESLLDEGKFRFTWEEAYDFKAEDISYQFMVATDWEFKNVIRDVTLINTNQVEVPKLEPGTYFWRVLATNERGKTQVPFDFYVDSFYVPHYGLKYLYISPDGEILERQREQP
jgi:spore coat protein H